MSQPNQMIIFITLHDVDRGEIEVNPTVIHAMTRENEGTLPITVLHLPDNHYFRVTETPQDIAAAYQARMFEMMTGITTMAMSIAQELANNYDDEQ